jgi:DNA invertase Pin-like site-specific DNA recombinase
MKMTKKEFEDMYRSMPTLEMCKKLGISSATLYKYLRKLKIEKKGKNNTDKITFKD